MDATSAWLWQQAMHVIRARERIQLHQDFNAAWHPGHHQQFRLALGEEAYDIESPEYANYVSGIAGERNVRMEE